MSVRDSRSLSVGILSIGELGKVADFDEDDVRELYQELAYEKGLPGDVNLSVMRRCVQEEAFQVLDSQNKAKEILVAQTRSPPSSKSSLKEILVAQTSPKQKKIRRETMALKEVPAATNDKALSIEHPPSQVRGARGMTISTLTDEDLHRIYTLTDDEIYELYEELLDEDPNMIAPDDLSHEVRRDIVPDPNPNPNPIPLSLGPKGYCRG